MFTGKWSSSSRGYTLLMGCIEQSEAGGRICISLDMRQLKPGKLGILQLMCPENLHRVMTDLSMRESFWGQRISSAAWSSWWTPDNTEINHSACWNVRLGKINTAYSKLHFRDSTFSSCKMDIWLCILMHVWVIQLDLFCYYIENKKLLNKIFLRFYLLPQSMK